jgi:hypothetical protein
MASTGTAKQGKSAFIKEVLFDNPEANAKVINEAWTADGMSGTISAALVSKVRAELGLTGNSRGRPSQKSALITGASKPVGKKRGRKPRATSRTGDARKNKALPKADRPMQAAFERRPRMGDRQRRLTELEADIDRMLFKVMELGGLSGIEESLRQTRRLLYRSLLPRGS